MTDQQPHYTEVIQSMVATIEQLRKDRQLLLDWFLQADEIERNERREDRVRLGSAVWLPPGCSIYIGDTLPERIKQMMKEAGREMK